MTDNICKVLVVDDIEDVRSTVAGILSDAGYSVKAAGSEAEAISILTKEMFHFIVIDIRLHGHDDADDSGVELAKRIRENGIRSKIIFVTGNKVKGEHFTSVLEYGVIAYIEKNLGWIEIVQSTVEENFMKFDVFLCHNSEDKPAVKIIGEVLRNRGLRPWLDEWELRPGFPWQRILEEEIEKIPAAAVFVGSNNIGPWQQMELEGFLREFVERVQPCPVIPVILPDCKKPPKLPAFLRGMTWVDFRKGDPDPMRQLIWGITGIK